MQKLVSIILPFFLGLTIASSGCKVDIEDAKPVVKDNDKEKSKDKPAPTVPVHGAKRDVVKKVPVGKNVTLEVEGDTRRVVIQASVCLREGFLEEFMTRGGIKAHEAILTADADAREIHKALLLTGAEAGHPVKFDPKFETATGTVVKVFVEYQDQGKTIRLPAQKWIRNGKTKGDLDSDWVFAGSMFYPPDPTDKEKPPFYGANGGDVICVCNMEDAMLDLPIKSDQALEGRFFEAHTERIPPMNTSVRVILEPVLPKKK